MSTINQITVGSTTYDIEDLTARKAITYCLCSSEGSATTKSLYPIPNNNWTPRDGSIIAVYFNASNTASDVYLQLYDGSYSSQIYVNGIGGNYSGTYTGNDPHFCGLGGHYIFYMWDDTYETWYWLGMDDIFSGEYIPLTSGSNQTVYSAINSAVPSSRTINGHALSSNITLTASDVNALSSNALANRNLYYTNVACAANTGDIATVSNAAISSNHVVAEISFAKPSYITTDVTWTTSSGSLVLNGTCTNATTANILLVLKDN